MISEAHPLDYYPAEETGDELTDSLALIDKARAALAQAETLSDIGAVREVAERARRYASAARLGRAAENHAARLRIEAERKAGALLAETAKPVGGRPTQNRSDHPTGLPPKLSDLGISKQQSSDWQRIARVPDEVFESHVQEVTKAGKPLTTDGVVQVARKIEKAVRAAEPKPIIEPSSVPARIEWGDARALPLDRDSVHLIVTSPPYSLDKPYSDGGDVSPEDWRRFMHAALCDMLRVTVPNGRLALNVPLDTVAGGYRPLYSTAVQMALSAGWTYRSTIVWDDTTLGKSVARGSVDSASAPYIYSGAQMIALFSKGDWAREAPGPSDLHREEWLAWTNGSWRFPGETNPWEGHPAAFPIGLPHRLIKLLSFPGDVVLDPFSGSGTTALAALKLGRQAIGFDRSEAYVASALRRIAAQTERAGSGAVGAPGTGAGLSGSGTTEVLAGGLRGRLDSGAGGPEEPKRVPAGTADLTDPFPHGTRVLVDIRGKRVFGTYLTIQDNGAGPVLGVDVTTNGGDRSIVTGMHWLEREQVYPLDEAEEDRLAEAAMSRQNGIAAEDDEDDDYPRFSDVPCSLCGDEVIVRTAEEDRRLGAQMAIFCDSCERAEVTAGDVDDDQALDSGPHDVDAVAGGV